MALHKCWDNTKPHLCDKKKHPHMVNLLTEHFGGERFIRIYSSLIR